MRPNISQEKGQRKGVSSFSCKYNDKIPAVIFFYIDVVIIFLAPVIFDFFRF
jgi:hypothetical protein